MVGGAAAIFLHTDLRVAAREATFQHGNLSRGVCPVAGYSCTLQAAIGTPHAHWYYLRDEKMTSAHALMLGLVHAICTGVHLAKESARHVAEYMGIQRQVMATRRNVDLRLLEEEAIAHMECQHVNGGLIITKAGVQRVPLVSRTTLARQTPANMPARLPSIWFTRDSTYLGGPSLEPPLRVLQAARECMAERPLVAFRQRDVCTTGTISPWLIEVAGGAAALLVEEQRSFCLIAGVLPMCEANIGDADALFATTFNIDAATGAAVLELEATCMVSTLEAALLLFSRLGSALRAIALDIVGAVDLAVPVRTSERAGHALAALHALGVPIVSSADDNFGGANIITCSEADYRVGGKRINLQAASNGSVSERAACPRERAIHFAAWLAHHPAIGLRHVLRLMRPRPIEAVSTAAAAGAMLLFGAGTCCEMRLRQSRWDAEAAVCAAPDQMLAPPGLHYATLSSLALLRPVTRGQTASCLSADDAVAVCAFEVYVPRHCASASALDGHHGRSGVYTIGRVGQHAACGEDEDAASMALTTMHRLLRRCGVRSAEVGVLHLGPTLLDRSKSTKTELVALMEASNYTDLEGVNHNSASAGGESALLSCVSWAQGDGWDGHWGVVVCSNDQVAPIGLRLPSASAAAALVGRGAPLRVGDARANVLEKPRFAGWLRMAPLPAREPHKQHEMQETVHIRSCGEACRWSAIRAVDQVSALQNSLS